VAGLFAQIEQFRMSGLLSSIAKVSVVSGMPSSKSCKNAVSRMIRL
jgi:hypothetical protein